MFKRIVLVVLTLILLAVVGLFALAYRSAIPPITPPVASAFAPDVVAKGEMLAGAGYCATCHTAKGGQPYAGGYAMVTPFGTIYSTNITPDPDTGIGNWSEQAFRRAMHDGVARDGAHLFPAFPYQHFNQVSDDDIKALYAFFMTRPPVNAPARKPDIPFPLNVRALQAGWKLLFFHDNAYGPISGKSPEWDRGAYLAEGISHCSACHSPRNALGAEETGSSRYAGAVVDNWYAPPLNASNPAPIAWSVDELYSYLRNGGTALHGVAAGSMSQVIHQGLSKLPDADVHAIAVYVADRAGRGDQGNDPAPALAKVMTAATQSSLPQTAPGAAIYAAACASCHYNRGPMPLLVRPELGLNSALTGTDPSTLIQVILRGIHADEGLPGLMMPGFSHSFSDAQVAELANWLRQNRTDQAPWPDLEKKVAELRRPAVSDTSK
jgi:mono/diheme cytochrome c family protein